MADPIDAGAPVQDGFCEPAYGVRSLGDLVPDAAHALGSPLGLTGSVSAGVVSGLDRTATVSAGLSLSGLIQFDAAVNPGSSGGPLVDDEGHVLGIVVALANPAGDDAFAGIGFAVPIGTALGGVGGDAAPQL